ncbi:MAG TPA: methionyl-tRNA formyltransferase [Candidatus Acidoferrum sp.]|jgi:methionyl-tRNA formyltransferase
MRLVFCGTPQFAVPSLLHLLKQRDLKVEAVITQPDRPSGRGREISFSAVKTAALAASLPVYQPEKIRSPEVYDLLQRLAPDAIVIIAYGQIIPARLLPVPTLGWINLHASLLPRYRGAAPINWAIVNGETQSGLTTMRIDAGMDTGDILLQQKLQIAPNETAPQLAARLSESGASLMAKTLRGLASATIVAHQQNHAEATHAPILKKEDGRIDWNLTAPEIYNRIRGFDPWPGTFTTFRGHTCHIWGVPVSNDSARVDIATIRSALPGTIFQDSANLDVACGGTTLLRLSAVKVEGRKQVSAAEFANGARLTRGERLGNS